MNSRIQRFNGKRLFRSSVCVRTDLSNLSVFRSQISRTRRLRGSPRSRSRRTSNWSFATFTSRRRSCRKLSRRARRPRPLLLGARFGPRANPHAWQACGCDARIRKREKTRCGVETRRRLSFGPPRSRSHQRSSLVSYSLQSARRGFTWSLMLRGRYGRPHTLAQSLSFRPFLNERRCDESSLCLGIIAFESRQAEVP